MASILTDSNAVIQKGLLDVGGVCAFPFHVSVVRARALETGGWVVAVSVPYFTRISRTGLKL